MRWSYLPILVNLLFWAITNIGFSKGDSNGDLLIGEWESTVSGTYIDCAKKQNKDNTYICSWDTYHAVVLCQDDYFVWNYGDITGTIKVDVSGNALLTWSTGSNWEKSDLDIQTDLPQDPNSTIAALTNLLSVKLPSKGEPFPKIRGPAKDDHVCIVGAGAAGIHMAVSLKDRGYKKITIFEKSSRVGGKCYDVQYDEFYQPIGAVFLQVDYFNTVVELAKRYNVGDIQAISMIGVWNANDGLDDTNKLVLNGYILKEMIKITRNTDPRYNLQLFIGSIIKYVKLHYVLFGQYEGELMQKPRQSILKRTAGTFQSFLERENLMVLIPLFLVTTSTPGLGHVDEVGALYGLMWNTPKYIISLALRSLGIQRDPYKTYVFKKGYENIWNTIVKKEKFDIRFLTNILKVHRNEHSVWIKYQDDSSNVKIKQCGFLIWTPPMTDLVQYLTYPKRKEKETALALKPIIYRTALMSAKNTIRNQPISLFRENVKNKIDGSVVLDVDMKGTLNYCDNTECSFTTAQYNNLTESERTITVFQMLSRATNEFESNDIVRNQYSNQFNASDIQILRTFTTQYSYKWTPEDLSKGYPWEVFKLQGKYRTWYAGASVSYETVKSVLEYNNLLLRQCK